MAKMDTLNFDVIINDRKFNSTIKSMEAAAQKFNVSVGKMLDVTRQVEGLTAKQAAAIKRTASVRAQEVAQQEKIRQATLKTAAAEEKLNREKQKTLNVQNQVNNSVSRGSSLMNQLGTYAGRFVSIYGASRFISSVVRITGEFETQRMALRAMTQDTTFADDLFDRLKGLALKSPFSFLDLNKYAKQLTAFSIPMNELYDTTKMLADVSAGLGVDMNRIILAYGQVRAATYLRGQEIRQFTEAGIPILEILAKKLTLLEGKAVSAAEVFERVTKRQISFEMVKDAFIEMTSEGGKFYNMQEVLANTVKGSVMKLKDAYQIMLNEIGTANNGVIKGALDLALKLTRNYEAIGKAILGVVAAVGVYKGILLVLMEIQKGYALREIAVAQATIALEKAQKLLNATILKNPYALLAGAVVLLGVAFHKAISAQTDYEKAQGRLDKSTFEFNSHAEEEIANLDVLADRISRAAKGTIEYNNAKKALINNYGKYYDGLAQEIDSVGLTTDAYNKLTEAIRENYAVREFTNFEQSEKETRDAANKETFDKIQERLQKSIESRSEAAVAFSRIRLALLNNEDISPNLDEWLGDYANKRVTSLRYGSSHSTLAGVIKAMAGEVRENNKVYNTIIREAIRDFGLTGTEYDPDFNGPVISKGDGLQPGAEVNPAKDIQDKIEAIKTLHEAFKKLGGDESAMDSLRKTYATIFAKYPQAAEAGNYLEQLRSLAAQLQAASVLSPDASASRDVDNIISYIAGEDLEKILETTKALEEANKDLADEINKDADESTNKIIEGAKDDAKAFDKLRQSAEDLGTANLSKFWEGLDDLTSESKLEKIWEYYNAASSLYELISGGKLGSLVKTSDGRPKGYNISKISAQAAGLDANLIEQLFGTNDQIYVTTQQLESLRKKAKGLISLGGQEKDLKALVNLFNAIKNGAEKGNPEEFAKAFENAKDSVFALVDKLSEIPGLDGLKDFSDFGDILGRLYIGLGTGNITQTLFAIIDYFSFMIGLAEEEERKWDELADAIREARSLALEQKLEEGVSSIFGEDSFQGARNAIGNLEELTAAVKKFKEEASGKSIRTKDYSWFQTVLSYINSTSRVADDVYRPLLSILERLGLQKYDEYGNLNADSLQAVLDAYGEEMTNDQIQYIKNAIAASNDYAKAMEYVNEVAQELFDTLADDIVDNWIDSFKEMGDVAYNMGEVFENLGETIVRSMMKSFLIEEILKKYEAQAQALTANAIAGEDVTDLLEALVNGITGDLKAAAPAWNAFLQGLQDRGLYPTLDGDSEGESALSSGVKSITEDTADLLASYINAIRADVSVMRSINTEGWEKVSQILMSLPSPTVWDNIAQIEAHTFNIEQNTAAMLDVITTEGGAPAIRTINS